MTSEQPTSETGFAQLKQMALMAAQKDRLFVSRDDLAALVECAEACKEWRDSPTTEGDIAAGQKIFAALRKLEDL